MELQRLAAARGTVEAVDVLGQNATDEAEPLELGDREVPGVRLCLRERGEPLGVELPELLRLAPPQLDARELLEAPVPPEAVDAAVIGKPALGRDAGAREDERVAGLDEQLRQQVELPVDVRAHAHRSSVAWSI